MSSDNEIVPFGKYRGQPVTNLASDRQYTDWLAAQPWFRDRYAALYTIIVNNFSKPEDTPEHNAMQALFLDDAYCAAFVELLEPEWQTRGLRRILQRFERRPPYSEEDKAHHAVYVGLLSGEIPGNISVWRSFETENVDVKLRLYFSPVNNPLSRYCNVCSPDDSFISDSYFRIEIKPTIGDDFPTVLRQMKGAKANTLLCGIYQGEGISRDQFVALFGNENIRIVFADDVRP